MTKTSNVKADFVLPIAVLTIICLVCSGLLGYINSITKPIIADTEARIAAEERADANTISKRILSAFDRRRDK